MGRVTDVSDMNSLLALLVPVIAVLGLSIVGIVWVVMSQRTRRQAIAAGMSAEQIRELGPRRPFLKLGIFLAALGLALLLIGFFKLEAGGPFTWSTILLCCGGALVLNYFIDRRETRRP